MDLNILDSRQVAEMLGLTNRYSYLLIERMARQKKLLGQKVGHKWRFHKSSIENFLLMKGK